MSDRAQTFLDKGTRFEGRILVTGVVRLDGFFKGDGKAQGTLVIGESGEVDAELEVDKLVVHGLFSGNVYAQDRVEVGPTGRVNGSVTTPILQVQDGAQITASIHMGEAAKNRTAALKSGSAASSAGASSQQKARSTGHDASPDATKGTRREEPSPSAPGAPSSRDESSEQAVRRSKGG